MGVTHYDRRLFITVPRRSEGVPSTLNYIDLGEQTEKSPKLRAYPNFEINQFQVSFINLLQKYLQFNFLFCSYPSFFKF